MNDEIIKFTVDVNRNVLRIEERTGVVSFDMEVVLDMFRNVFVNQTQTFTVIF